MSNSTVSAIVEILSPATVTASGKASSLAPTIAGVLETLAREGRTENDERTRERARIVAGDVEERANLIRAVKDGRADAKLIYRAEIEGFILREPDSRVAKAEALRAKIKADRAKAREARKG